MKEFLRRLILKAKWATDSWFVTDEMYEAVDRGDLTTARRLLKEKEKEWPNSDPELVSFSTMIAFYEE